MFTLTKIYAQATSRVAGLMLKMAALHSLMH